MDKRSQAREIKDLLQLSIAHKLTSHGIFEARIFSAHVELWLPDMHSKDVVLNALDNLANKTTKHPGTGEWVYPLHDGSPLPAAAQALVSAAVECSQPDQQVSWKTINDKLCTGVHMDYNWPGADVKILRTGLDHAEISAIKHLAGSMGLETRIVSEIEEYDTTFGYARTIYH